MTQRYRIDHHTVVDTTTNWPIAVFYGPVAEARAAAYAKHLNREPWFDAGVTGGPPYTRVMLDTAGRYVCALDLDASDENMAEAVRRLTT